MGWVGLPSRQQPDANLAPPSSHPVNISTGDTHWQKIINTNIPHHRGAKIFQISHLVNISTEDTHW